MLDAKRIEVAYGEARAIDGVSLAVAAGELVCVVGPNGAGKSTLINAIAGLLRLKSGTLTFDGVDLARLPPHRFIAAGIAVVPEGRRLFTRMTVRENLEMGSLVPAARRERGRSLDRMCDLFPALSGRLDVPAGALSGGQQQMVAIARALMAGPRLLLLDEPSLGLSPLIVAEMFAIIRAIHAQGVTILLVEQNVVRALEVATRACVLEEGRIVKEGDRDTLLADPALRRAYLGAPGAEA
ncbi:MAG: ABC transporter ATP-binding protein [Casimicrobiaceae bacterium]